MHYVLLGIAIVGEVCGTTCMKLSDGFKRKLPTVGLALCYLLAFGCLGVALTDLPLGVAMGIWAGLGTALTAVIGALVWKEGFGWKKLLGIALIIGGVVILEVGVSA